MCSSSSRRACKASSVDTPFSSRPRDFTSFARALDAATTSSRGFMSCCFSRSSSFTSLSWSRTGTIASRASSRLSFASLSVSMASSMIFVSATTRASLRSISASCSSSAGGAGTRTIHSWRLGKAREALSNEAVVTSASSLTPPRPPREKDVAAPGFISEPDLGPDLGRLGDLEGAGEDASSGPGTWPGRSTAPGERDAPLSFLETRVSLSPLCGCLASGLSKPGGADIRGAFVAALAILALCEEAASSIARISTWGLTPSSSIWRPDPMRTRCSCEVTGIRGVSAPRGRDEARAEKTVCVEHPKRRAFSFSDAFDAHRSGVSHVARDRNRARSSRGGIEWTLRGGRRTAGTDARGGVRPPRARARLAARAIGGRGKMLTTKRQKFTDTFYDFLVTEISHT